MAIAHNSVTLMGHLTADPVTRYTQRGTQVTNLSLAINRQYTTEAGEKREEATFVDIVAWDKLAAVCSKYLAKGAPVFVQGRLNMDKYKDKDGNNRSKLEVVAENIQFLGGAKKEEGMP